MDKIICVGKNYLEHAKELGDKVPEKPVLFLKPPSVLKAVKTWGDTLPLHFPWQDSQVQPECELVLQVAKDAYQLKRENALEYIAAVSLGLDVTLRTRQTELKKQGHPWTTAKVFMDAAVVGPWIALANFPNYLDESFSLSINGVIKQNAQGKHMMMSPLDLLVYISEFFPLCAGDIIFTGTPQGVFSVSPNSMLRLQLADHWFQVQYR